MQQKLDSFDRRLLALVQQDANLTSEQLGDRVNLSASAVQRRLNRLRAAGVILSVAAIVDPEKVGRPSFFVVGLEIERERPELLKGLRHWLSSEAAVQQVFYVTGEWDFILVVTASGVAAYDELMTRLLAENPNVRRFTTNVALAIHKRSLAIPVDTDGEPDGR